MRRYAGVFGDTTYSDTDLAGLARTAAAYVERLTGHTLQAHSVIDRWPHWPTGERGDWLDRDWDREAHRRDYGRLTLSAASPYRAAPVRANYEQLTLHWIGADESEAEVDAVLWRFDATTHRPSLLLDDALMATTLSLTAANPVWATYQYVPPALAAGAKEAVSFVFKAIFAAQNTGDVWETEGLRESVNAMTLGLGGGAERAQVF